MFTAYCYILTYSKNEQFLYYGANSKFFVVLHCINCKYGRADHKLTSAPILNPGRMSYSYAYFVLVVLMLGIPILEFHFIANINNVVPLDQSS